MKKLLLCSTVLSCVAAFNNKGGWKMDGDKIAVDSSGNPIFVKDDGQEMSIATDTVTRLNNENKTIRERAEAAERAARAFEGLDAETAKKAIETVSKLDAKKLIDAGEVDKLKNEIAANYESKLKEYEAEKTAIAIERDNLIRRTAFQGSKFIAEKVAVPAEMFEAVFGRNFKVENGKVVPYDQNGNVIYSPKSFSEVAAVDEAFEIMVNNYADKDRILKAPSGGGTGSQGAGGNRGNSRQMKRAEFEALSAGEKMQAGQAAAKGEITIVD